KGVREKLFELTRTAVRRSLLNPDGSPTATGKRLLAEMNFPSEIIRSSYGGEDRPYKSGAGQYDSFPNAWTDRAKLEDVADGLASNWDEAPVENNLKEQYNLNHIFPSLVVMKQVDADYSGVMQTRDEETGHRGTITYQAVPGFGGGVESADISESGKVTKEGLRVDRLAGDKSASLFREGHGPLLRKLGLRIERIFHEQIEPGRAFPVDSEWAVDKRDGNLYIVQARTLAR
ncbi:MAG TPA: PEP/pyruvate-binding domain-containing protein, partial [Myxococcaceae bacterium]|nr:PEP/pyruvate-binding domain-containing protein [Myxococcaceae bacterium]